MLFHFFFSCVPPNFLHLCTTFFIFSFFSFFSFFFSYLIFLGFLFLLIFFLFSLFFCLLVIFFSASFLGELLAIASDRTKDALKLIHLPTGTVFQNWPSDRTPLRKVTSLDFSPGGGYLAVGNSRGRVLLYRLNHYGSAWIKLIILTKQEIKKSDKSDKLNQLNKRDKLRRREEATGYTRSTGKKKEKDGIITLFLTFFSTPCFIIFFIVFYCLFLLSFFIVFLIILFSNVS